MIPIQSLPILLLLAAVTASTAAPLRFSAMGCGPYRAEDEAALRHHIAQENRANLKSSFIIHLGDINSGALAKSGKLGEAVTLRSRGG